MSASSQKGRDAGMAIQILGREYRVGCPPGEELQLQATVDFVNERIGHLRDAGRITGNEKLAVMAALNIAHEFLNAKSERPEKVEKPRVTAAAAAASGVDVADLRRRIVAMQEALEAALGADQGKLL